LKNEDRVRNIQTRDGVKEYDDGGCFDGEFTSSWGIFTTGSPLMKFRVAAKVIIYGKTVAVSSQSTVFLYFDNRSDDVDLMNGDRWSPGGSVQKKEILHHNTTVVGTLISQTVQVKI
jgi:hypothetical protein